VFAIGHAHYDGDSGRVWLPLLDGTERLGVLELVPRKSSRRYRPADDAVLASVSAELIVARQRYGDAIEHTQWREPMQARRRSYGASCRR
jgi:hypothetical protein